MATALDRYGRVVIPKEIRSKLGLRAGVILEVVASGDEITLKPRDADLEKRVRELSDYLSREAPKPFGTVLRKGDSKWLSRDYCLKKLGLLRE